MEHLEPGAWNGPRDDRMLHLVGEMVKLPGTLFIGSLEVFLRTARQLESIVGRSVDAMVGGIAYSVIDAPAAAMPPPPPPEPSPAPDETFFNNPGEQQAAAATTLPREAIMADTNLSDDMVKLVRYTILTIQRDDEHILGERRDHGRGGPAVARGEKVVTDNMSDESFSNWVITDYLKLADHESIGDNEERKYLRVCYEVLGRWPKQDRKYEKRQLEALEGIQEALGRIGVPSAPNGAGATGSLYSGRRDE